MHHIDLRGTAHTHKKIRVILKFTMCFLEFLRGVADEHLFYFNWHDGSTH